MTMTTYRSEEEYLKNYTAGKYPTPLITVDIAIFTINNDALQVLLVKRAKHPSRGKWALPGGFVDLNEDQTLEDTARRKLKEKTGVNTPYLEQVATFGNADRDPRGWSVTIAYFALINSRDITLKVSDSSEEVTWVPLQTLEKQLDLAFDHQSILNACHHRLKSKVHYTALPVNLLPDTFTLTELQKTFEIVLGKNVEKKSFRRRILDANILEETGEVKKASNRPAKLYRVRETQEDHYFNRNIEGSR